VIQEENAMIGRPRPTSASTILLVENDRHHEELVLLALEKMGFAGEIIVLVDGESVVELFLGLASHVRQVRLAESAESRDFWQAGYVCASQQPWSSPASGQLRRRPASPCDLVLLGLNLPKLGGLKVLRQLRWLHRDDLSRLPPIVVLSERDGPDIVADAYRHGACGFLSKAMTASHFIESVHDTVRYWLGATTRPARELANS
jgi:CheY-like chemotaxis protein